MPRILPSPLPELEAKARAIPPEFEAVAQLHEAGAWFVLATPSKRPTGKAWQTRKPTLEASISHLQYGGLIGFIPGRSGLWVCDIDECARSMEATAGDVAKMLKTRAVEKVETRKGLHLYFRRHEGGETIGNREWIVPGVGKGDIRGDNGFVILWDLDAALRAVQGVQAGLGRAVHPSALVGRVQDELRGPAAVAAARPGTRNEVMNREAFRAAREAGGIDKEAFRNSGLVSGLDRVEIDKTLESAETAGAAQYKPKLPKTREGLALALHGLGIKIRWNVRASRPEVRREGEWEQLTTRAEDKIKCDVEMAYSGMRSEKTNRLHFGRESWRQCLSALMADAEVDPFLEWIEALPEWDGIERLEHWTFWVFDLDERSKHYGLFAMWAARYCFLAPIQRAYQPGCELQQMPVFLSEGQGVGKSMALKWLFPEEAQPAFYEDGFEWGADEKVSAEKVAGKVIVEVGEMKGSTAMNVDRIKRYVSATHDTVRLSYDRRAETRPRRFALVGTGNGSKLPPDPTGNRRFVAVPISGRGEKPEPYMDKWRIQLWAEALLSYRNGKRANLPDEWRKMQEGTNQAYRSRDDLVEDVVMDIHERGDIEGHTMAQIQASADGRLDKVSGQRIGKALRTLGYINSLEQRRRVWRGSTG